MIDTKNTMRGATETSEGVLNHLYHREMLLPVKLSIENTRGVNEIMQYQSPLRIDGRLVYALPGGGSICP